MSLSRKHFVKLAALVEDVQRDGGTIGAAALAYRLADFCASDSERFDRDRFLVAALGTDGRGNLGRDTISYPRTVNGRTVWACCESSIGPVCGHLS